MSGNATATKPNQTKTPKKASFLRRWIRRLLWTALVICALLIALHRPLIRWTAQYFGQRAAKSGGMQAEWQLLGNFLDETRVEQLKISGNATAPIQSLTLEECILKYELTEISGRGAGAILKEVSLRNLDADIDLTRAGNESTPASTQPVKNPSSLPQLYLPKVTISHVNLRLKLEHGVMELMNFSLTLDPAGQGIIAWDRLSVAGAPDLINVRGTTRMTLQSMQFENVALGPHTVLRELGINIARLAEEHVPVNLDFSQDDAHLVATATISDWSKASSLDASIDLRNLHAADLERWGVPSNDIPWGLDSLSIKVRGPVTKPAGLDWSLTAQTEPLSLSGLAISAIALDAAGSQGHWELNKLHAAVGANNFSASGAADLPNDWSVAAKATGTFKFELNAASLKDFSSQINGAAEASGIIRFGGQHLQDSRVDIISEDLAVAGIPVQSVVMQISALDHLITLSSAKVVLNAENHLDLHGQVDLEGEQAWSVQWGIKCPNLASVPETFRRDLIWPDRGSIISDGEGSGTVTSLKNRDWKQIHAKATIDAGQVRVNQASMQSLKLKATMEQGIATLEDFALAMDGENVATAGGQLNLNDGSMPMSAAVDINFPGLNSLSAWAEMFGAPKIEEGKVHFSYKGEGNLSPLNMEGDAEAHVTDLKFATMAEALSLNASAHQQGAAVSLPVFEIGAGPWKAAGNLNWDGTRLDIMRLDEWLEDLHLATLTASLPLKFREEALRLQFRVDPLDSVKISKAVGQTFPIRGTVTANGEFSGTLGTLTGSLNSEIKQIVSKFEGTEKLKPGALAFQFAIADGNATADLLGTLRPLEPIHLTAAIPADISHLIDFPGDIQKLPIDASFDLPKTSLDFLPDFVPALRRIAGSFEAHLKIAGTVTAPKFAGNLEATISDASFIASNLPSIKDLELKLDATDEKISISKMRMFLAGGQLKLTGEIVMQDLRDPAIDLKLLAEEILVVRDESLSQRANASITCQGSLSQATVQGGIDLVRGRVFKEIEFLPLSLPEQLPPPPAPVRLGKETSPALPPPFDKWKFDLAIKTKDPIRLMGNVARGGVLVDMLVSGLGSKPDLTGNVTLEDASVKLPFCRMTLASTVISFTRDHPFDPQMELIGEAVVGNYMVTLNISGRALDPKLRFTSSPPLSEGDITYLLATGTTASDLGSGNGEAAGRAMFMVFKSVYRKMFPKLARNLEDSEPPRLTFELSGFGNDPKRRGVAAIYEINSKVKAIGRVGETGTFRGLLYYLIRFR